MLTRLHALIGAVTVIFLCLTRAAAQAPATDTNQDAAADSATPPKKKWDVKLGTDTLEKPTARTVHQTRL